MPTIYERFTRRTNSLILDYRYGGFTGGLIPSLDEARGLECTVSTAYHLLQPLLGPHLERGDVFVDIGCGKGRVLNWVLEDGRAKHVFGVEINKTVAAGVARRLANESRATIIAGDAMTALPDSATFLYMWNPFGEDLMRDFKAMLIEKYTRLGTLQKLRIVYHFHTSIEHWKRDSRCIVTDIDIPRDERQRPSLIRFR